MSTSRFYQDDQFTSVLFSREIIDASLSKVDHLYKDWEALWVLLKAKSSSSFYNKSQLKSHLYSQNHTIIGTGRDL